MKINIKDLPQEGLPFSVEYSQDWLGLVLGDEFQVAGEGVRVEGRTEKIEDSYYLRGTLQTEVGSSCGRCLEPHKVPLKVELCSIYIVRPPGTPVVEDAVEYFGENPDLCYLDGDEIDLDPIVREQVILALPMHPVCKSSCAGLCKQCGQNRNLVQCGCEEDNSDPRWAPLKNIKLKNCDQA